jgi:hypothetical protein
LFQESTESELLVALRTSNTQMIDCGQASEYQRIASPRGQPPAGWAHPKLAPGKAPCLALQYKKRGVYTLSFYRNVFANINRVRFFH